MYAKKSTSYIFQERKSHKNKPILNSRYSSNEEVKEPFFGGNGGLPNFSEELYTRKKFKDESDRSDGSDLKF
jgi:hypothetical protein